VRYITTRSVIAGTFAVGFLLAQEPKQESKPPDQELVLVPDIRETFAFVIAPASVQNGRGDIVNGLTPKDFELFDNGKLQSITEDVASHPISLVVAVQASANMDQLLRGIRKIGTLCNALILGEYGEMAVLSFDHRVQTLMDFTSDGDKVSDAFNKLKPGSSQSHLNDAAMAGVNKLRNRDKARRRILLVISESRDKGSIVGVRDVLTAAEFQNVVVYTVDVSHLLTSLTYHPDPPRPNGVPPEARLLPGGTVGTLTTDAQGAICCTPSMGDLSPIFPEIFTSVKGVFVSNPLEVYTKFTGGREYSYMTQNGLEQAISDIGQEIHSQYLLTYFPNNSDEGGYHQIELRVLKPLLKVTTRPGYWAAAKPK